VLQGVKSPAIGNLPRERGGKRPSPHGAAASGAPPYLFAWKTPAGVERGRHCPFTGPPFPKFFGIKIRTCEEGCRECSAHLAVIRNRRVASAVGLAPPVPITAKLDQDFFAPRWSGATDRQQTFMQVIATLESTHDEFTIQEICGASRQILKKPFVPSHATQMLGHLSEKGCRQAHRKY
jgi:hypothetical protein